jgi:drug/metabolite transporter (DMT)-like permease
MKRQALRNWLLLVLVNAMWAAQYPAYKTASEQIGPVTLSGLCFLVASLLMLPFYLREKRSLLSAPCLTRWTARNSWGFLMVGVLGLIPASALLAWGTQRSNASNAAILSLSVPLLTAILAWAVLNEKMTPVRWLSLVLSLGGVLILSGVDLRNAEFVNRRFLLGNLLVLAACASSSVFNVYSKELLGRFSQFQILLYSYWIAAGLCVPLALLTESPSWSAVAGYRIETWLSVLVLSTMTWGLAMVLWMKLLTRLDVNQASVSIYLLPFLGVLLSVVTLHEKVTAAMLIGGAITLLGTLLITCTEAPST